VKSSMDDQDPRWAQNMPLEAWKKPPLKNKKNRIQTSSVLSNLAHHPW
jgi:hypothetical protein